MWLKTFNISCYNLFSFWSRCASVCPSICELFVHSLDADDILCKPNCSSKSSIQESIIRFYLMQLLRLRGEDTIVLIDARMMWYQVNCIRNRCWWGVESFFGSNMQSCSCHVLWWTSLPRYPFLLFVLCIGTSTVAWTLSYFTPAFSNHIPSLDEFFGSFAFPFSIFIFLLVIMLTRVLLLLCLSGLSPPLTHRIHCTRSWVSMLILVVNCKYGSFFLPTILLFNLPPPLSAVQYRCHTLSDRWKRSHAYSCSTRTLQMTTLAYWSWGQVLHCNPSGL